MARKTIRVYPSGGNWVVKKDDTNRASAVKRTKQEALEAARDIALNQGLSVAIHGKNGKIQKIVRYEDRNQGGNNCFITTACVKYYGLKDDCYHLQTLRNFRDNYLANTLEGKLLIKQYYLLAPKILIQLEADRNKKNIFKKIFKKIKDACLAIENNKLKNATKIYKDVVVDLLSHYKII